MLCSCHSCVFVPLDATSSHWNRFPPKDRRSSAWHRRSSASPKIFVPRIVIASNNPGKLRELDALLKPLGLETVSQSELGVGEAEEPHETFLENALAKARHASRATGLPALADDSGLCVPALGGEPGVHSAYFAGRAGTREERDARNNAKLVEAL